jgi:anti-anti-sigma regulatory factor
MDTTLKIGPSANIQNCNAIRDEIVSLLDQDKSVSIDISELSDADTSFVQLAFATLKYASSANKSAAFAPAQNEYLAAVLTRAGLSPSLCSDTPQSLF